eukprot:30566-Pelagococcus_subviridis.AAC.2
MTRVFLASSSFGLSFSPTRSNVTLTYGSCDAVSTRSGSVSRKASRRSSVEAETEHGVKRSTLRRHREATRDARRGKHLAGSLFLSRGKASSVSPKRLRSRARSRP